jgi:hypothetical protein
MPRPWVWLVLLALPLTGCRRADPAPPEPPWFEDVTEAAKLDFVHDAGPLDGKYFLPQIVGSGCALFDMDGDGRLDVYLVHNGGPKGKKNQLFRQRDDGTFLDVSAGSGLDVAGHGMGVAVGDVNNDGLPDVLLTEYGGIRLFLNQGGGKFRDVTREAGMSNPHWATSACFLDYDRDGRLDLVVVNYLDYDPALTCRRPDGRRDYCNPVVFAGSPARLFRNTGGKGGVRFEDRTLSSGLAARPGPGLGVVAADLDGDGWVDILVANDGKPNHLWINQKDGTFREEALERGLAVNALGQAQAGMGIAVADVNGDGLLDVLVTHLTEETHTLWLQGPPGLFRDATAAGGLALARGTGFGAVLADFDCDGEPDLAIVNGRVARGKPSPAEGLDPFWHPYAERNLLLAGAGRGRFRDVSGSNPAMCGRPGVSRAVALGDLDGDGALDLLVTTVAGRARLLRNVARPRGHWLAVRALDPALKRDAYGALVTVRAGGRRLVGVVQAGQGYLSSHDPRLHFGLGQAARVDGVEVRWPDGRREVFPGPEVDRPVTLERGKGAAKP